MGDAEWREGMGKSHGPADHGGSHLPEQDPGISLMDHA